MLNPTFKNKNLSAFGKTIRPGQKWVYAGFMFAGETVKKCIYVGPFKVIHTFQDHKSYWYSYSEFLDRFGCLDSDTDTSNVRFLNRKEQVVWVSLYDILLALRAAHATIWLYMRMVVVTVLGVVLMLNLVFPLLLQK